MIWMLTATAAMLAETSSETLEPRPRAWGGDAPCDAARVLLDAAGVERPTEGLDDPMALLNANLHVLEAWEQARGCSTVQRELESPFRMFSFAQVLVAAARVEVERDPVLAAERALEAYAAGHDVATGPLLSSMVGIAVHLEALDVLAEVWPALSPNDRRFVAAELERLNRVRPRFDLEAEAWAAEQLAQRFWLEGTCLDAHATALGHVRDALAQDDPELLEPRRAPTLSERLTGCGLGIERIVGEWLEDDAALDARVATFLEG